MPSWDVFVVGCRLWGRCYVLVDVEVAGGYCDVGSVCGLCFVYVQLCLFLGVMSIWWG